MSILIAATLAMGICALAGALAGRLAKHQLSGCLAIVYGLQSVEGVRSGEFVWALIDAVLCAFFAWHWWHGGGGDGTKRRLRSLRRKFEGVRRTAPAST